MTDDAKTGHGSVSHTAPRSASPETVRAAEALVVAGAAETAITIGHFAYGAHIYNDPGRLHIVEPALVLLIVAAALAALFAWRPSKLTLGLLSVAVSVPYIALFGLFHGAYSHVLKDALFLAGAPDDTLEWLFMSPDYVRPNDFVFEASGILGLVAAAVVGYWLVRLFRARRRPAGDPRGASPQGGPTRLVGLAFRMLFDAPFKSLGTLVGVVVSVFLMSQQSSLLVGILGRVTSFVNSSGVDIWITSVATESTDATDSLPASKVGAAAVRRPAAIAGAGHVTGPAPRLGSPLPQLERSQDVRSRGAGRSRRDRRQGQHRRRVLSGLGSAQPVLLRLRQHR